MGDAAAHPGDLGLRPKRERERGQTSTPRNKGRRDERKGLRQVSAGERIDERRIAPGLSLREE